MDGHGVHAYKFVNATGEVSYVKFHWDSLQGETNLTAAEAEKVQAKDFNHASRDLVQAIERGEFPKWDLYVQVLKPEEFARFDFNPLDATKVWTGVPETKIGTMTLNRNPANVFQETEQSVFAPANLVPGIEPSEDRLLQGAHLFLCGYPAVSRRNQRLAAADQPARGCGRQWKPGWQSEHSLDERGCELSAEPSPTHTRRGVVQVQPVTAARLYAAGAHQQDAELPTGR